MANAVDRATFAAKRGDIDAGDGDIISRTAYNASASRQIGFKPRWSDGLGFGEYGMRFTSGPVSNEQNGSKLHFYMAGNNKVTIDSKLPTCKLSAVGSKPQYIH